MSNYMVPALSVLAAALIAADYRAPAGNRFASVRIGAEGVLPGGRIITPIGRQAITGPGPFGLAINARGDLVVTANGGPVRYSLTALRKEKNSWNVRQWIAGEDGRNNEEDDGWRSVFMGLAFAGDDHVYASEGNSGRVRLIDARSGSHKHTYDLNRNGFADSYTGDLAYDSARHMLYVVDQANFRLAIVDTRKNRVVASQRVGRMPFSVALSPDGRRAYVTNLGMFEYKPIPGADRKRARETGLPFPAFPFPSPEAAAGVRRETALGPVDVPGLGDPNVPESNSLCVVNVENPEKPAIEAFVRTGLPFGERSLGGSSPTGVEVGGGRVFVSNGHNDTITVIDAASLGILGEIPLRIPGLESLRGVLPVGMAYHEASGWLLVAEAGINAVAVVDTAKMAVIGHLPAAWFPTRLAIHEDTVWVTHAKGHGTGPNATRERAMRRSFQAEMRRGAISSYPVPDAAELPKLTARVMFNNGFLPRREAAPPLPDEIRHVVLIVKENRTFDEVFGDIETAANGAVAGAPTLARFGRNGIISQDRGSLQRRLGLRNVNVTPNHQEMARRWAFSDNFYADSEISVDGHHWLVGTYPNAWTESTVMARGRQKDFRLPTTAPGRLQFPESNSSIHPEEQLEAGAIWHHLERHGISFRNYGEGFELAGVDEGTGLKPTGARFLTNVPMPAPLYHNTSRQYPQYNMNIPDQYRATQFIKEVGQLYVTGSQPFPRFLFIHLPNDHLARARPEDGYPFEASYMADNDYALGRIVEYLSKTSWWRNMAILVTEDDAQGGVDHIDSHRTVLLVISPYAKQNYVSHVNSSFPGLLKTAFRLLGIPPLNLYDAAASDLSDCFTRTPDFAPYQALAVRAEIFDPATAREPMDPKPSPPMDDPGVLRQQHRRR